MQTRFVAMSSVVALLLSATALGLGALNRNTAPANGPGGACPLKARPMARLELFFGAARPNGPPISESDWQRFLDEEVTPRFPQGLTVLTATGQWGSPTGKPVKEPSRILMIWHDPVADTASAIEAIRAAYKARFEQESVMRVDGSSCVSF